MEYLVLDVYLEPGFCLLQFVSNKKTVFIWPWKRFGKICKLIEEDVNCKNFVTVFINSKVESVFFFKNILSNSSDCAHENGEVFAL